MKLSIKQLATVAFGIAVPALAFADEAAHEAGHGEHGGWDTSSLVASFVNFAILIGLFVYLFKDTVSKSLKARRAQVEHELQEAARLKAEAEVKHKEYSDRLAKLDQELDQIKSDMIAAGKAERDRIIADAEQKAARMRREAEFLVEQQVKQLRQDLSREATEGAVAAAEQLLLRATTTYDQQRLAQEYLAALSNTNTAAKKPSNLQPESRV